MNYRQKIGYIVLGSLLTLTAMGIGALLAPPLTAQHNGVFEHIECKSLTVVDPRGRDAIMLEYLPTIKSPTIRIDNPDGTQGIVLATSDIASTIFLSGPDGLGVLMGSQKGANTIGLKNPGGEIALNINGSIDKTQLVLYHPNGKKGAALSAGGDSYNSVTVFNDAGDPKTGIVAAGDTGKIYTIDMQGNINFHKP